MIKRVMGRGRGLRGQSGSQKGVLANQKNVRYFVKWHVVECLVAGKAFGNCQGCGSESESARLQVVAFFEDKRRASALWRRHRNSQSLGQSDTSGYHWVGKGGQVQDREAE
jgi:hypothetical protein